MTGVDVLFSSLIRALRYLEAVRREGGGAAGGIWFWRGRELREPVLVLKMGPRTLKCHVEM